MSALTDHLGAHGAPATFSHDGKDYTVTPVNQLVKTKIERWLRKLVYADLYASREDMPSEQYEHALSLLAQNRNRYAYLGPLYWQTVGTPEGMAGLVAILFQTTEEDAKKLLDERGADVDNLVSETIVSSMPRAAAAACRLRIEEIKRALREGKTEASAGVDPTPSASNPPETPKSAPSSQN